MSDRIGFFTPVSYAEIGPRNAKQRLIDAIDSYLFLGGRKAFVIDNQKFDGKIYVDVRKEQVPAVRIALKVATYVLFALPLLIVKLAIRLTHRYYSIEPKELIAQADRIRDSNVPEEKLGLIECKKQLLASAYAVCIGQMERKDGLLKKEQAFTVGEILSKFAIINYKEKALKNSFEVSKQILLGALNAQLYAAGILDKSFDFAAPEARKLRGLPGTIVDSRLFKSMEAAFSALDTEAVFQKIVESKLTASQRIVLCQTLRYINGAQRHLIDVEANRAPTPQENDLFKKLVNLADKVIQIDADKDDAKKEEGVLRELWELRYNDFPYFLEKVARQADKIQDNWKWLFETCKLMPKTYLKDISRLANKSAKSVDDYKAALNLLKTALLPYLDADTYANLENILERNDCNEAKISSVASKLMKLDPACCNLNIAWFAMVPSNLAYAVIRDQPQELKETRSLLLLSKMLVDFHEAHHVEHQSFKSIKHNFYLLDLLSHAKTMQSRMKEELIKVKEVGKDLTHLDIDRFEVSITHLRKSLRALTIPLIEMKNLSEGKKYGDEWTELEKLKKEAHEKINLLRRLGAEIQKDPKNFQQEAAAEKEKVEDLLRRSSEFAQALHLKATPQKEPKS